MSEIPASQPVSATAADNAATMEIDASCRLPLMVLFLSAAIWGFIASVFALIASLKFHSPNFLAGCECLTYGRVWPAGMNAILYGFCIQAGLGVALWLLARLGRVSLCGPLVVTTGAALWNLGVTVGVIGILAGDSTGFENLEMPRYASVFLFLGYLLIGIWAVLTFHRRREPRLFVSQWFLFTALFWFPWAFSTAEMLLVGSPVRGMAQAVVAWWYSENLLVVWFGLVGLAALFYFLPKLTKRELYSREFALFTFWTLILLGGWGGIPNTAPVPAWMPTLSGVASVLMVFALLTLALNVHQTLGGQYALLKAHPTLLFIGYGLAAFLVAGVMKILGVLLDVNQTLYLTWFTPARVALLFYGFFAMTMFGAVYYILPRLVGLEFYSARLVRAHFWLAGIGGVVIVAPLALAGVFEALKLSDSAVPFTTISKGTLMFLRVSTLGNVLLVAGQIVFVVNLVCLASRYYRTRAAAAYTMATAELKPVGVKP